MAKKIDYASLYTLRSDGRYQGSYRDENGKRHSVYDRDPEKLHFKLLALEEAKSKPATFEDVAADWHYQVMPPCSTKLALTKRKLPSSWATQTKKCSGKYIHT